MSDPSPAAYEALIQFLYQAPVGLVRTTLEGDIVMINPMSAQLLMPLATDGNMLNLFDVLAPLAPGLREMSARHDRPGSVICDALRLQMPSNHRDAGGPRTLSIHLLRLDDATLMATVIDATGTVQREQQRLAAELHVTTRIDHLTALPNRLAVLEKIDEALLELQLGNGAGSASGDAVAVLLVNADRFERINVTLGQAVGDSVLRSMATRIQSVVRSSPAGGGTSRAGCTTARSGGDEFAVLLHLPAAGEDAAALAGRLVDSLALPYPIGGSDVHVTASVGVVTLSEASRNAVAVLQDASLAMREAKRAGGARSSVFEPRMLNDAWRRGSIEAELRRALDEDQLFVVYQPILRLSTGEVAGMEALVRWRHPERGVVPPIEFIEIAEETGLIGMLGEWVLHEACRQMAQWQRTLGARAPRTMSVNLSRAQVVEPSIVETVARALAASRLDASALQLEVTESLAAQDPVTLQRLNELKALGLTLALDDFGTGYSSLSSLHLMPIDVVKIDRSFVSQAVGSAHHRVLIEAVSKVARSLGMETVAEGIETTEQAAVLVVLDCDKGQGYFYSRPLPGSDATDWLTSRPGLPGA